MTDFVRPESSAWRLLAAFVVAPLVPAVAVATFMWWESNSAYFSNTLILVLLFGAYPAATILGAPAYLVLHRYIGPSALACGLVGGAIAAIPWLTLGVFGGPHQATHGGKPTVVDGVLTAFGWMELLQFVSITFALGAVGGLVFWAIAGRARGRR